MSNVYDLPGISEEFKRLRNRTVERTFDGGGGGGYDDRMEARIAKLEEFAAYAKERLGKIESRLDQTATKSDVSALQVDMHKGFSDMVKWVVGTAIVLGGTAITVMTFVLNNATPKATQSPTAQPAPIVIYTQPIGQAAAPQAVGLVKPATK